MARRFAVSEFPNDNPELHDGLVWACPAPCAPALPTLRLREAGPVRVLKPGWEPATPVPPTVALASHPVRAVAHIPEPAPEPVPETDERAAEAVSETVPVPETVFAVADPAPAECEPASSAASQDAEAPSPSGFESFIAALSSLLIERGATRAAAHVGALLGQTRLGRDAFDAPTRKVLAAWGILDAKTGRPTPEFSVVAHAWRDVLDGANGDLSACGSTTLDVWGSDIVTALLGSTRERADDVRRALRQRGVAAFGMLVAA